MCLFRKCDETVIETKEYPSLVDRIRSAIPRGKMEAVWVGEDDYRLQRVTTIKCNACGRVRIDQRSV